MSTRFKRESNPSFAEQTADDQRLTDQITSGVERPRISVLLSDKDVAKILGMTVEWVRSHSEEIPGAKRLGMYYRFRSETIEKWLGGLALKRMRSPHS
jgi:hypothetical protein